MRIVSLVPSATDLLATIGAGEDLVGVTTYCTDGAPEEAVRIGGTKNPSVEEVLALRPDLVVANTEENKPEQIDALREAGVAVEETYPRTVRDAITMTRRLGEVTGHEAEADRHADAIRDAIAAAEAAVPSPRVMALTLVWRRPWMGLGPDTYADDLLWTCGFGNVLSGFGERYPRLEEGLRLGADVVLLPSEPYEFGPDDRPAVAALAGEVPTRFVDGQALTWHGPRTAAALRTFSALARELAGAS